MIVIGRGQDLLQIQIVNLLGYSDVDDVDDDDDEEVSVSERNGRRAGQGGKAPAVCVTHSHSVPTPS